MSTPKGVHAPLKPYVDRVKAERALLRKIVAAVDEMRSDPPDDIHRDMPKEYHKDWFSGFENTGINEMADNAPIIEWPKLSELALQGRKLIGNK